jgi:hypothetical protein
MEPAERSPAWVTPSLLESRNELASLDVIEKGHIGNSSLELALGSKSVWVLLEWADGARLAVRAAFAPDGLSLERCSASDHGWNLGVGSSMGSFTVQVTTQAATPLVGVRTSLVPAAPLKIPFWPRDLLVVDGNRDPLGAEGVVHFHQRGPRAGLLYGSVQEPGSGSFLYLQDLTALNPYCRAAKAALSDTVGGQWPELGFALPPGEEVLQPGTAVVLSSAFIAMAQSPSDQIAESKTFLELLSQIYPRIQRPQTTYRDWPGAVRKSLKDLRRDECWTKIGGDRYLDAYLGDKDNPPEIMVQLAVLVPLAEYAEWRGRKVDITEGLERGLAGFFDEKTGAIGRWHPAMVDKLKGDEPHKRPRLMDSWYLYHPLLNLSRLALRGNKEARDLFLKSLPFVIEVAHHFKYRWPVLYDLDTLEVIEAESKPGEGGENDVAGFHTNVMLQAWKLTSDPQYLEEARASADSLTRLGFNLAYQMNTTVFGAAALLALAVETGEDQYRDLSEVCLANIFTNLFLWECEYGYAEAYPTFFGLFPLADAPYTAAYEEVEAIAALDRYLRDAGDGLPERLRILLPEMIRHLLNRGIFYYPPELPSEVVSDTSRTGSIDRGRWLPLEDLYEGDRQAGQVGQQIYGAGSAFGMIVRHYWPVRKWGLMVYCDYPIDDFVVLGDSVGFSILGDPRFECEIRLIPTGKRPLPVAQLEVGEIAVAGSGTPEGHRSFNVQAGQKAQLKVQSL